MKNALQSSLLFLLLIFPAVAAQAELQLPAIFSDHMLLQQKAEVPVWGWAEPGAKVQVQIAGQTKEGTADQDGRWEVKLDPLATGKSLELKIVGDGKEVAITDVLVGEVWLGSGQSNMAMQVSRAKDFEAERKQADLPQIRMFTESSNASNVPGKEGNGSWKVCSPDTVGGFSATLFFFGREIQRSLDVPVGLINSSVGGTPIESWIAADVQQADPNVAAMFENLRKADANFDAATAKARYEEQLKRYRVAAEKAKAEGKPLPVAPRDPLALRARKGNVGGLFNGKIEPLIPYAIRGAIWYQGEANSTPEKAPYYQYQLPLLIKDWRKRWGYDFPFAWAQLPNYQGTGRDWPTVREAMLKTLAVPNTGMGINIDIGETKDIHPKNKQEVGRRLSLWALGTVYEQKVAAVSGPLPDGQVIEGKVIAVNFKHAAGLKSSGGELKGFEITADGEHWETAKAQIDGERVMVSSPKVDKPIAVRYAWENDPVCNLVNGADLPATPFRTGK